MLGLNGINFYRHFSQRTMLQNLSKCEVKTLLATQILCEIGFGNFEFSKIAVLTNQFALTFDFVKFFRFLKA